MEIERSLEHLTPDDLKDLYAGSVQRLEEYFVLGPGRKWHDLYDIQHPMAVALCQGAALHYIDKVNGIKDFDVWFFYPFNQKHLPYRTIWNWDYQNPKFGHHPSEPRYTGRRVDVIVRSIKQDSVLDYLKSDKTSSARELARKAVILLAPELGKIVWPN